MYHIDLAEFIKKIEEILGKIPLDKSYKVEDLFNEIYKFGQNSDNGRKESYEKGYNEGHKDASEGKEDEYDAGHSDGYHEGYTEGYKDAELVEYQKGYNQALRDERHQ